MSEKLKIIAELIKSAQSVEAPPLDSIKVQPKTAPVKAPTQAPAATVKTPAVTNTPVAKPKAYAPEVKNMQEALKIFAKTVTSYSTAGGQMTQAGAGKKAFNDFITEGFMSDKPIKGVEWTTDKKVTQIPQKQKTQTDLFEMDVVVDGLNRLGSPKSEMQTDGVWGPRTENALNNTVAFARALMEIDKRFTGKAPTEFTEDNVKYLEAAAALKPSNFIAGSSAQSDSQLGNALEEAAKFLEGAKLPSVAQDTANTVNALTKYYTNFLQRTLSNPKNAIFIQQDKPLDKVKKRDEALSLDENDKALLGQIEKDKSNGPGAIHVKLALTPDNVMKEYTIPLYYLTNKSRFKEFCEQQKIRSQEGMLKVLNDIQAQIKRV